MDGKCFPRVCSRMSKARNVAKAPRGDMGHRGDTFTLVECDVMWVRVDDVGFGCSEGF